MKRFTFSLQSVKDQRQIRREAAEREFAEAAAELIKATALLDKAINERAAAIAAYTARLESGGVDTDELILRVNHIALLTERERDRRARIELFERAKEAKRTAVVATTRAEKVIDKLSERHRAQYDLDAARIEQTALDEMATNSFARRCE